MVTMGSQNQDRRAMLLNGEVVVAISGYDSLITFIDFMFIMGTATWPANAEELEDVFPKSNTPGLLRKLFWLMKDQI